MTHLAESNAVRFDPSARRGHVESYFLKANDASGDRALWVKATIFCDAREPDRPLAEGWAIAFDRRENKRHHVATKHQLPLAQARFSTSGLDVAWQLDNGDRVAITPGRTQGSVRSSGARITWDLSFTTSGPSITHFPASAMYTGALPKSKLLTPFANELFDGHYTVQDGAQEERVDVTGWRGMQGHNWGRGHAELYGWCHVNQWEHGDDLVVEGVSARVRIGPVLSPLTTLVCVRHEGRTYDFNRPMELLRARGEVGLRHWEFRAESDAARIEGLVQADGADMVGLYYPNPDGPMTYCLNSKLARAHVRFEVKGRPPVVATTRAAALEVGTRREDHGVRMYV